MAEDLGARRDDAARRSDEAGAKIPAAILSGDEKTLAELRRERHDGAVEADDLTDAIDLQAERDRRAAETEAAKERRRLLDGAELIAAERLGAARRVDGALVALESAVLAHREVGGRLSRALRSLGIRDDRVALKSRPDMRWAAWASAPEFSGLASVPFSNAARRRPLEAAQPASVPDIGASNGEDRS